jgi:hypothetical protein
MDQNAATDQSYPSNLYYCLALQRLGEDLLAILS